MVNQAIVNDILSKVSLNNEEQQSFVEAIGVYEEDTIESVSEFAELLASDKVSSNPKLVLAIGKYIRGNGQKV